MNSIFSSFNLTPLVAFLAASGVLIVGIHLAFRAIQISKKTVVSSDPVASSFPFYDDSGVSFDPDFSAVESFAELHFDDAVDFSAGFVTVFDSGSGYFEFDTSSGDEWSQDEWFNSDFDPDFDFESEAKYDSFAAAYYEARRSAENPQDMDQWEFANELRGGMSLEEYLQVDGHQEYLRRYYSENPSQSFFLDLKDEA